jgi:carboxypeptidase family protein/prealbumin domain-containing protein
MDGEMKILRSLALVALLLPLAACDDTEPAPIVVPPAVGIINGQVTIEGEALQGVTVTLGGPTSQTATSAADGKYSFQNVLAGTYAISLSNLPNDATFTNPSQQVTITTNGQVVSADFQGVFIRTAAITGLVIIDEDPISGISVAIDGIESQSPQTTDNLGSFAFTGLRSGAYTITITSPDEDVNFGSVTQNVTLAVGQAAALTFAGFVPEEPTVSIGRITTTAGGLGTFQPVNPSAVVGQIDVTVNFDAGDETAESVGVWVRNAAGTEIELDRQTFTSSGSGAASSSETVFSENTAMLMADGVTPIYLNGDYAIFARLVTVEGTTVDGELRDPLTFANPDRLTVVRTSANSDGVVSGAIRWFGGANGAAYEARAIIYSSDISVASIGIAATNLGGSSINAGATAVNFGSGFGATHTVAGNPAAFTVTAANNAGGPEDLPFPSNGDADGSGTIGDRGDFGEAIAVRSIIDTDGVQRLPDILQANPAAVVRLTGQLFDFVAPVPDQAAALDGNGNGFSGDSGDAAPIFAASELTFTSTAIAGGTDFDNDATLGVRWFNTGVAFGVTNFNELGVGFVGGGARGPAPKVDMNLNVNDLLVPTTALFSDVANSSELTERASGGYELEITSIQDALGNSTAMGNPAPGTLTGIVSTVDDVAGDNASDEFGVDLGAVAYSLQAPVPNAMPTTMTDPLQWIILNNTPAAGPAVNALHTVNYTVDDPTLADTNAPAGVNGGGADISLAFALQGGATTTLTDALASVTTVPTPIIPNTGTAIAVTADAQASGVGAAIADGAYVVTATTTDQATDANSASQSWWIVLMSTPPVTQMNNPPAAAVNSSQNDLTFTINGSVTGAQADLDGDGTAEELPLTSIVVTITDDGGDNTCGTGDDLLLGALGAATNANGNNNAVSAATVAVPVADRAAFSVNFTLRNNVVLGAGDDPEGVCFVITATDTSVDNTGAADNLASTAFTQTTIDWS